MRRRRGEAGYILFYPLLLLAVFGVLASSCLPRYTAWYHQENVALVVGALRGGRDDERPAPGAAL